MSHGENHMLNEYKAHVDERANQNIPPLPLDADQTAHLVDLLKADHEESELLLHLLKERVPAGVDQAAYVKAAFLSDITTGKSDSPHVSKVDAVQILGTMLGGYNIQPLIECLKIDGLEEYIHSVDIGNVPNGMYFVKIVGSKLMITKELIKNN